MDRRTFFSSSAAVGLAGLVQESQAVARDDSARFPAPAPLPFREEKSGLKITGIRAVKLVPKRPLPTYEPAAGSWNTSQVEVANPLSVYPRFKPRRSLFYADDLGLDTVRSVDVPVEPDLLRQIKVFVSQPGDKVEDGKTGFDFVARDPGSDEADSYEATNSAWAWT